MLLKDEKQTIQYRLIISFLDFERSGENIMDFKVCFAKTKIILLKQLYKKVKKIKNKMFVYR